MADRLRGKVAIVTGCGSSGPGWGNGKATAVLFAREGAKVFGVDLSLEAAEETKAIIDSEGGECTVHEADVAKSDQVRAMVDRCIEAYGRIDVLLNNVGISSLGGPVETSEEEWDRVLEVNLKGMFLTCKYVLPHMERQGGGAIVNVSSVASITGGLPQVAYSASKAGINQLTQTVALQYAKKNIRANCVLPGLMDTPMIVEPSIKAFGDVDKVREIRNRLCPTGRMGTAWDTAYACLFLASDEARYITATHLIVDGGLSACVVQVEDVLRELA